MNARILRLKQDTITTYREGGGSRPDVLLVRLADGQHRVLKDFGACDPWFSRSIGWLLAARECRALNQLKAIEGVPQIIERLGARAFLMEHAPATPIMKVHRHKLDTNQPQPDWNRFLLQLDGLIDAMHSHGVTHGDLRSPHNVLISEAGDPWIVDFVSASFKTRSWTRLISWPFELLHRKLKRVDKSAVDKYRSRLLGTDSDLSGSASTELADRHESLSDRFWRQLGVSIRNLSRRLLTRQTADPERDRQDKK